MTLQLASETDAGTLHQGTRLLVLTEQTESITFINIDSEPVPSILTDNTGRAGNVVSGLSPVVPAGNYTVWIRNSTT